MATWIRAFDSKGAVLSLLLLASIGFCAGCSQPAPSAVVPATNTPSPVPVPPPLADQSGQSTSTLTIALPTGINSLEFPYAAETNSQNAARSLYDSLLYQLPDGSLQGALAASWQISDDGRVYTFNLRDDIVFHNGEPFNADAVVFTWQRYSQRDVPFGTYFTLADSVEKVDEYTVRVKTREPNALLLPSIALAWMPIPPRYYQEVGARAFAEHPVGTGPFVFQEWVKDDHLTLRANPNYWRRGFPLVDAVVFKFIPESTRRLAALSRGEVDIAPRLSAAEAATLAGVRGIDIIRYPVDRVYYVAFNNVSRTSAPTLDRRVRLAMNYAVDRRGIVNALLDGSAQLAVGFIGTADLGWQAADPYPYDPERARQLLAEAGYADGFDVDMACPNRAYTNINEICEAIVRYLDKVNIRVSLQLMESNTFWELEKKKELPPLFVDGWASTYREAFNRLEGALTRSESWAAWYDPELEARILEIGHTLDRYERARLYARLQERMRDDPPFIYLYYPETLEGVNTRVNAYRPRAGEDYDLWNVSLKPVR